MSDTIPVAPPARKITLDDAITNFERLAKTFQTSGETVRASTHQQMCDWLRELKELRAAMNMEPRLVTG